MISDRFFKYLSYLLDGRNETGEWGVILPDGSRKVVVPKKNILTKKELTYLKPARGLIVTIDFIGKAVVKILMFILEPLAPAIPFLLALAAIYFSLKQ